MHKFSIILKVSTMVLLGAATMMSISGAIYARPAADQQTRQLKRQQRQQSRQLKEEQHATKAVMNQHPTTPEARKRFNNDLKMQRHMLRNSQKADRRTAKENQELAKKAHYRQTVLP